MEEMQNAVQRGTCALKESNTVSFSIHLVPSPPSLVFRHPAAMEGMFQCIGILKHGASLKRQQDIDLQCLHHSIPNSHNYSALRISPLNLSLCCARTPFFHSSVSLPLLLAITNTDADTPSFSPPLGGRARIYATILNLNCSLSRRMNFGIIKSNRFAIIKHVTMFLHLYIVSCKFYCFQKVKISRYTIEKLRRAQNLEIIIRM